MAMFQCAKHGLQGVKCVCEHIQKSVIDDTDIKCTKISRDDFLIPSFWLCNDCRTYWESTDKEDIKEEFIEKMKMICGSCFDEWAEQRRRLG